NGLSDGTYTIKLIVNNTDNDFFMDYAVVVLDNNLPQIKIISPLNQSYQTPSIWFNTTMNKIGSSCSYSVDGGTNISMDNYSLYNWSGLNTDIINGGHSIVFYCSDSYGNKNLTNPLWFSVSASTISNCSVLDVPNTLYYITADILDSSTTTCINISAENITVECQNHIIDGINTVGTYGVYANNINATIRNCQISNWHYGVYLNDSINSTVYNSVMDSNYYGLYLNYSSNNTIFYNIVKNSSNCGIYLNNSGSNGANNIYNNLLNNTDNTELGGTLYSNNYNITNSGENRIYSIGNDIGGNYYTNSTGNDYSDTCADVDKNGFCDSSYSLDTGNIDHLPLSNKCAYLNISSCSDLSYEGITYNLTTDVSSANTCFSIISNNITLDCNGYTINYSTNYHVDSADGNAVNITNYNGTTIKNCNIIGGGEYDFAIFLNTTNNAKIQDNNITLRGDGGIIAVYSFSNNITNNIIRAHTFNLALYNSSFNNVIGNTIK
ncbi:MAG: right-handed parallel beta-helix repeat-containing protein, partial [Candidatus Aenigmarchaeota archaeon]|nr:right-handed parallel beta-helix repeat-containing protein [Candidatus Aenigmarchaeota archaeon]